MKIGKGKDTGYGEEHDIPYGGPGMAAFMVLFVAPAMAYAYDDCDPVEGCNEKEKPDQHGNQTEI